MIVQLLIKEQILIIKIHKFKMILSSTIIKNKGIKHNKKGKYIVNINLYLFLK